MLARKLIEGFAGGQAAGGGGAYRYWRLYCVDTNGNSTYLGFAEIELHDSIGGADLTSPSTTITSSHNNAAYPATNAIDGDLNNMMAFQYGVMSNAYITLDLITAVSVKEISIRCYMHYYAPKNFKLQGSNDGSTFTDVKSYLKTDWVSNTTYTFLV